MSKQVLFAIKDRILFVLGKRNLFASRCYLKSFKSKIDFSKVPKLNEDDLQVQYVRGSGPGGQATNKTNNAVVLTHTPTGIVVKCHESRSQFRNKEIAQEILINKLDLLYNKEDAIENQEKKLANKISCERKRRQKKLAALKENFKKENGLDS